MSRPTEAGGDPPPDRNPESGPDQRAKNAVSRLWHSQAAAAWTAVVVAIVLGVPTTVLALRGSAPGGFVAEVTGPTGQGAVGQADPPGEGRPTTTTTTADTPAPSPCADVATGTDADCAAPTAALRVGFAPCTVEATLGAWGVAGDDSLLLEMFDAGGACLVAPAQAARDEGATAADLQILAAGSLPAALRECARDDGAVTVSCAAAHQLEWVGPWQSVGGSDVATTCVDAATRYTDADLGRADLRLAAVGIEAERADGTRVFRCAVYARGETLQGSVRGLGYGPIPLA